MLDKWVSSFLMDLSLLLAGGVDGLNNSLHLVQISWYLNRPLSCFHSIRVEVKSSRGGEVCFLFFQFLACVFENMY